MPANLTQQYHKAEQAYRQATTPEEELSCLQLMLSEIPKHKGTDHLQASLKSKIAKLKKELESGVKKAGKKVGGIKIPRQGAGTVILLGGPNAGKSQLLVTMTRATPEVANYPFTTHAPMPGMMPWEDVMVQLIDMPPVTADFMESYTYNLIRSAELVLLMLDLGSDDGVEQCQEVLDRFNDSRTRLGRESYLDHEDIGVTYTQTLFVPNKIDLPGAMDRLELFHELFDVDFDEYPICSKLQPDETTNESLEKLRNEIYRRMDVVRVYTKLPTAKEPDMDRPFTIQRGRTLLDLAGQVHKDYIEGLKFARVWGSAVHDATVVKGDYELHDRDIVELHL